MRNMLLVAILIFIFAGCAQSANPGYNPSAQGTAGARLVEDSRATIDAATAIAGSMTKDASMVYAEQTAVAQIAAEATESVIQGQRNDIEIAMLQDSATATHEAHQNDIQLTRIKIDEISNDAQSQALLAAAEVAALATRRAAEADHDALVNRAYDIGTWVIVVSLAIVILIGAGWMFVIIYGKWKEKNAPIIQVVYDNTKQTYIRANGGIQQVGRPRELAGATIDQLALPATTGDQPPAKWESFMNWQDFSKLPLGAIINDTDGLRRPLLIDPKIDPFLMIVGRTRSGKSIGGLMPYILAMWAGGAHVVVINGYGADFQPLRGLPNITFFPQFRNLSDYLEPLAAFLTSIRQEGQRRNGVLAQYRVTDWRQLPAGVDSGPILIAIDELLGIILSTEDVKLQIKADTRYTANERKLAMAKFDQTVGLIWSGLNQISSMYGKHGIHIVATLTDPTAQLIGDVGMAFRRQCAALAFKMQSASSSREFLNVDSRDNFPRGSVGLPTGQFIASINGDIAKCAAFYPSPQDVGRFGDMKRPFIVPSPLPYLLGDGLAHPERLTIGNEEDDVISGVFEEVAALPVNNQADGRRDRNVMILDDNINRFESITGAARVLFVARAELDQATNPAGWMIVEARETLNYMAVQLGNGRAAGVLGLS